MKCLSFIALFFYLGLLSPSAELSAINRWVKLPKSNTHVVLASQVSVTYQAIYFADPPDDDSAVSLWHSFEFPLAVAGNIVLPDSFQIDHQYPLRFLARAPPANVS